MGADQADLTKEEQKAIKDIVRLQKFLQKGEAKRAREQKRTQKRLEKEVAKRAREEEREQKREAARKYKEYIRSIPSVRCWRCFRVQEHGDFYKARLIEDIKTRNIRCHHCSASLNEWMASVQRWAETMPGLLSPAVDDVVNNARDSFSSPRGNLLKKEVDEDMERLIQVAIKQGRPPRPVPNLFVDPRREADKKREREERRQALESPTVSLEELQVLAHKAGGIKMTAAYRAAQRDEQRHSGSSKER